MARTRESKKAPSRSGANSKTTRSGALSLGKVKGRYPAIDLRTNTDVSTLVCIELSKSILMRPEVNTGQLFSAIAASDNDVNKSDAVIVITAAIMEAIGSSYSAKSLLNKSRTVSAFYERMNLTNESVRNSFVIMLFAIAPEFVKMIESAVKISIERVQEMTNAPHANEKMITAAGEILKDGCLTTDEHYDLMDTFSSMRLKTDVASSPSSVMSTPDDMIGTMDSISQVGKPNIVKDTSPMTTRSLMRYIKGKSNNPRNANDFYKEFPSARRPVESSVRNTRTGVGFPSAESAFTEAIAEDSVAEAVNTLFNTVESPRRHKLSAEEKRMFTKPVTFVGPKKTKNESEIRRDSVTASVYQDAEMAITREDIEKMKTSNTYFPGGGSKPNTNPSEDEDEEYLLSLL